ncbi:copper-binding protein [Haloferax mediterranei ATCC 33500]|uniref:Copper-binding protein n=2 Tax=Haloferacaceae TaxID=1644056 RepID=I3R4P1_HALMT|nr:periplasmic copper-binding protein [Haloferax mediterranei ATCC 33500]AHZ21437.1 copper-binding protein [Haloferax mediterranei ATCC 33500]EMA03895.1 copper-binding protein [Haloferax mediterranei ATCC 33500]QCQ76650.1 copper-binding protein [Haloferax mediterranei ATCC 33500]
MVLAITGVIVAGTVAGAVTATAQEPGTQPITDCTTITSPGVYTLGKDITNTTADTCIQIETSDVVLNGGNHTLIGDGDGIAVDATATEERAQDAYENVTVRSLNAESWETGISFVNTRNATATNVAIADSVVGVQIGSAESRLGYVTAAHRSTVSNATLSNVDSGVLVVKSNNATVVDNTLTDYSDTGVHFNVASNSSVHGNEITDPNGSAGTAISLSVTAQEYGGGVDNNVVASNRIVNGTISVNPDQSQSTGNRIIRNEITNGSIAVSWSRGGHTLVADNRLTNSDVSVEVSTNVTVEDNVLTNPNEAPEESIYLSDAGLNTVQDNTVIGAQTGILLDAVAQENAIVDNKVINSESGIELDGDSVNNTVAENTLINNGNGIVVSLVNTFSEGTNDVRKNNIVNNENGLLVKATDRPLIVESNSLRANTNGILIQKTITCSPDAEGAELVSVHGNVIAGSGAYGVLNENQDILNATGNFWGARDGPSSADDEIPGDPVTGTLANGSGTAVSEDSGHAGQSNVQFDSWLQQPPEDAERSNETAS